MTDTNIGRLLANRYYLVDLVGEGAMGRVYWAKDSLLGEVTVAVKFLSHMLLNDKMRSRFEREATISALLGEKSIHIVRVRDYGVDENDIPFYVMEFLEGESLSDIIQSQYITLPRFFKIIRQICVGLKSAHQGIIYEDELCKIIHRDIKPSNILIVQEPTVGELVKILDFGIAKLIQASGTMTHSFMGTLAYCSPEQMEGKELDERSDIYSLGIVMYEMLTGDMPLLPDNSSFGGWYKVHHYTTPEPFDPELDLPETLQDLVMRCLAKSPQDRPQSIQEIQQTLESLTENKVPAKSQDETDDQTIVEKKPTRISLPLTGNKASIKSQGKINDQIIAEKPTSISSSSIDELCLKSTWPKGKPNDKKIVFPKLIQTPEGLYTTLWVMLDYENIIKRKSSTRYNEFHFLRNPHPIVLWITLVHNREHGPRWLPCYLDMKARSGQQITRILAKTGSYRILFFSLGNPEHCQNVMTSTIAPKQCGLLSKWAMQSQAMEGPNQPQLKERSKNKLKDKYEKKLKSEILRKLEAKNPLYTDISGYSTDISG